ncbi:MAG: SusC/RagA family TonB-linked outer membrane protein, partial [Bacteroidales bacterium]
TFTYLINRSKPIFLDEYPGHKPASGYEGGNNPIVLTSDAVGYDKSKTYYFSSDLRLQIKIPWVKGLSLTGTGSVDKDIYSHKVWSTPYLLYSWDRQTYDENGEPVVVGALSGPTLDPTLDQSITDGQTIMVNGLLNYERSIAEKHNFKLLVGIEKYLGESASLSAYRRGFVSTALDQMFAGGDVGKENGGSTSLDARLNYFGRLNYDYRQKYLVEFVFRYDGSYIFPEKGRYGFFPGISLGWRMSEEGFWKNSLSFINFFKLRGSWGQTGNDRITPYQYLSSYGFGQLPYVFNGDVLEKALTELRIANPNVTWEIANQSNVGFDLETLNGKINLSAEYFYNLRTNILWYRNASVPATTGLILPRENIGEVINKGYEIQVGYKDKTGNFDYSISGNISVAHNKIKYWDETPGVPDYQQSTGRPMNAGLYYNAIGIFSDVEAIANYPHWTNARPGDIIFEDVNKDEKIDGLDQVRVSKTDVPTFTGGLSINLGYKRLYASVQLQGAAGAVRTYSIEAGKIGDFLASDAEGRWTADNPNATKPRTWNTGGEYWSSINNTYWLKNNDYVRLKNLQIGYNVSQSFSNKLKISDLNIYFSGLNLLTFSKEKAFDPETFGTTYPMSRVFNFGIRVTL